MQALKGAGRGIVKIGVSKPLPVPDGSSVEGEGKDTTRDNTVSSPGSTPNETDEEDRTKVEGSDFDGKQGSGGRCIIA